MSARVLLVYPGAGRAKRIDGIAAGIVPRDFFYGYLALLDAGRDVAVADSRRDPSSMLGRAALRLERLRNRVINLGYSAQRVRALQPEFAGRDVVVSFTDGFSLSLGLYGIKGPGRPLLVGGFHGLSDSADMVPSWARRYADSRVRRALNGLDHIFFFGEPDRQRSIRLYGLPAHRTSLFPFGIDTSFWCPDPGVATGEIVLSVGSDPKRDFATLIAAPTDAPVNILTRLPVVVPAGRRIEVIQGSYHGSAVDDVVLRTMYRTAAMVVVPLQDVWQPTGYSVVLQAMACGRPVILSDFRGLWDRDAFVSGENCLLVSPGNPVELAGAIDRLRQDPGLRQRLGEAARQTALTRFDLSRMNAGILSLIGRFDSISTSQGTKK